MSELQKRLQELDEKIVGYRALTVKHFQERRKEVIDAFVEFANLIKDQTTPQLLVAQFFYLSQAVKYGYSNPKVEERLVKLASEITASGVGDMLAEIEKIYPENLEVLLNIAMRARSVRQDDKCIVYLNRALKMKMSKEKKILVPEGKELWDSTGIYRYVGPRVILPSKGRVFTTYRDGTPIKYIEDEVKEETKPEIKSEPQVFKGFISKSEIKKSEDIESINGSNLK